MDIGERIRAARESKGWSQAKLAAAVNQGQTTVSSWERGRTEPTREDVARISEALGLSRTQLEHGEDLGNPFATVARRVPVVGVVQAGAWVESAVRLDEDEGQVEFVWYDEPAYRRAKLFSLEVRGPSANRYYPEGSRVICAVPHEAGVREGDFVVAQRQRGDLFETTLKQVQLGSDGGIELWPRSTHPDFQEPIIVRKLVEAQEGVSIIGVVIAKYEPGRLGHGPLLDLEV
jgi:transcriptional regulator with XRE-family HTH domain